MPDEYNYAAFELAKLDADADRFGIRLDSRYYDSGKVGGQTRWLSLTPDQKDQVAALLISFNL